VLTAEFKVALTNTKGRKGVVFANMMMKDVFEFENMMFRNMKIQ
jgi:hypothetical protein